MSSFNSEYAKFGIKQEERDRIQKIVKRNEEAKNLRSEFETFKTHLKLNQDVEPLVTAETLKFISQSNEN